MTPRIYSIARARILEIWKYTEKKWGEKQADDYVRGLYRMVENASKERQQWRGVIDKALPGVYFIRYRHHYIFFRELSEGRLGVINILHEKMDIPSRLKENFTQYLQD